jgi:glycosyltransferase involved in cell wall biosynthesis
VVANMSKFQNYLDKIFLNRIKMFKANERRLCTSSTYHGSGTQHFTLKRIRIIIVTSHPPWRKGGVESYNRNILSFLTNNNKNIVGSFDIKLITYIPNKFAKKQVVDYSSKVLWISVPSRLLLNIMLSYNIVSKLNTLPRRLIYVLLHIFYLVKGLLKYLPLLKKSDIIVSKGAFVELLPTFVFATLFKKKIFIMWHTNLEFFIKNPILRALLKLMFGRAYGGIFNAIDIAERAKELGLRNSYFRFQDVDVNVFKPLDIWSIRRKLGIPEQAFVVLYAGPLNETKMADIFIEIMGTILRLDRSFIFIIIGEGPLAPKFEELRRLYSSNVIFINNLVSQEELNEYFNASDIVFACADSYYPARIALEALSAGRPVLIPNVSLHDRKRRNKFKIPLPNVFITEVSPKSIALFLLNNKNKISELSRSKENIFNSRNYIVRRYSADKQLKRDLKIVLKTLLKSPKGECE